jgi:hypothetical protein
MLPGLLAQEPSASNMISSRGLILQSMMYGLNVYQEIRQLMQQYKSNEYLVFYFSKAPSNIDLFVEFFFEILNERCEPVVIVFEALKAALRLREYSQLLVLENINVYIDLEAYKDMKKLKEIKETHFKLIRSRKQLPKIPDFKPNPILARIKNKQAPAADKAGTEQAEEAKTKQQELNEKLDQQLGEEKQQK